MIRNTTAVLAPLFFLQAAMAQAPFVAPVGYAQVEGETALRFPFHGGTGRGQFLLSKAALTGMPMFGSFARIALRPDGAAARLPKSVELSVSLSNAFQPWIVDGNMLRQRGPDHAEFFARQSVQLPAAPGGAASATRVPLVLDRPFVYYGDSVCLEIAVYASDPTPWPVDAVLRRGTGYGTAEPVGASYPRGRNQIGSSAEVPWPNGLPIWEVTLTNPSLPGGDAMLVVGTPSRFHMHHWRRHGHCGANGGLGNGLFLLGDVVDAWPMDIQGNVTTFILPPIPNEPELAGDSMFLQWVVRDPSRPFGIGLSNGLHVTLGRPPLGSAGWAEGDPADTQIQEVVVGALVVEFS